MPYILKYERIKKVIAIIHDDYTLIMCARHYWIRQ